MQLSVKRKTVRFYLWVAVAFWLLMVLADLMNDPSTFLPRALNHAWLIGYELVLDFVLLEYVIPFIRRSWKRMLLSPLVAFAFFYWFTFGLVKWRGFGIKLQLYTSYKTFDSIESMVESMFPYSFVFLVFLLVIRHIYKYIRLKQSATQLLIEKQSAELNYLKSQTNPHFLFNTLNNIYSLARDKSDLAPESILRLSEILRFMLYETGGAYIGLHQELKIIDDYIALERLRYDESLKVNIKYDVEDMRQAIPPLLLIPLVENAFKHGVSETRDHPFVDVFLSVRMRQLEYVVKNSADDNGMAEVKENIGLSNLRRQLELLYTNYQLAFHQKQGVFTATLTIKLASHV